MNSDLREKLNVLRAAGIAQNNDDDGQLLEAIRKLITTATAVVVPPTLGGTGLDYVPPGNYLVGNGTATMTSRTPDQVFDDLRIAQYVAQQRRVVVLSIESPEDANKLTLPDTLYKWGFFGGMWTNFPNVHSPGYLLTRELKTDTLCQELTLVEAGSKALCYFRFGTPGGTWQPWRVASAFSKASQLPTWDAGDIYVDGIGWHHWNGTAYAPPAPPPPPALTDIRLGVQVHVDAGGQVVPAGCVSTGAATVGNNRITDQWYRPLQKLWNGAWVTVSVEG